MCVWITASNFNFLGLLKNKEKKVKCHNVVMGKATGNDSGLIKIKEKK